MSSPAAGKAPRADVPMIMGISDRFGFTLFLAATLHVMVVFGINFTAPAGRSVPRQLDVTLSVQPSEIMPDRARHAAATDQLGSGTEGDETPLTSSQRALLELPVDAIETSEAGEHSARNRLLDKADEPNEATANAEAKPATDGQQRPALASNQSWSSSPQANWDTVTRTNSREPKIRRVSAESAQRSEDAAYLLAWRQRVEDVGNRFYPEASRRYGIYGSLDVLAVIDERGQLLSAEILRSSGHAVLDEAALRIIRMSAPFPAFPPELRASTDRLEIVRSWHFQDNAMRAKAQ